MAKIFKDLVFAFNSLTEFEHNDSELGVLIVDNGGEISKNVDKKVCDNNW